MRLVFVIDYEIKGANMLPYNLRRSQLNSCVIHRHPFTIIGCYEQRNSAKITMGSPL